MITVMVPTRGRRDMLAQMLESYEATRTPGATELIFRADDDDPRTIEWLSKRNLQTIVGPRVGYRYCCKMFAEMAAVAKGTWLMTANDDIVFTTLGWDKMFLDAATRQAPEDGIAIMEGDCGEGWKIFPFPLVHRRVFETLGFIHDERILWGDTWLHEVFKRLGRIVSVPEALINHDCQASPHVSSVVPLKMGSQEFAMLLEQTIAEAVATLGARTSVAA